LTRVRRIEIQNYRTISRFEWHPSSGINCLVGPGDSGKSTILDAIELCLGTARSVGLADTDFYAMDVSRHISISITLGALPDELLNLQSYGDYLRAFNPATHEVQDEPRHGWETVLTLNVTVGDDLEPAWRLVSERATQLGIERGLGWKDRLRIAPARLGPFSERNLSWSRGSVLNRLSEQRPNLGAELASAARDARASFGERAGEQLQTTLDLVTQQAQQLGVPVGTGAKAMLDAHAVAFGEGAITLHNSEGIPLRALGTGSSRLLVAGLQRAAAQYASILLVDEVEYGLEPHRLTRLLDSLGAKDPLQPMQVFMTTHSPVALRELSGNQVFVVRLLNGTHQATPVGVADDIQSTIRRDPEAFLARTVIVCEGASEIGFVRGMDQYCVRCGQVSLLARGVAHVDAGGGEPDNCFVRGIALLRLGYRVIVLIDSDKAPTQALVQQFQAAGGLTLQWRAGRALEDELFTSLPAAAIDMLIARAIDLVGEDMVEAHIRSASENALTLQAVRAAGQAGNYPPEMRTLLGKASRKRKNGWFKSVGRFEGVAVDIVFPHLNQAEAGFIALVNQLHGWANAA